MLLIWLISNEWSAVSNTALMSSSVVTHLYFCPRN